MRGKIRKRAGSGERQKTEIPVDNLEFSTLSTGFSTGVFHTEKRAKNEVVFYIGRHNLFRPSSTKFYFSPSVHFDHGVSRTRKNSLDKDFDKKFKIF